MDKIKVAVITEIPTPYRTPVFRKIADLKEIDLMVFYCAPSEYGRAWEIDLSQEGYPFEVLKGSQWTIKGDTSFAFKINWQIWSALKKGSFDLVVIGGYAHFTMLLGILFCLIHNIPYLIASESHLRQQRHFLKLLIKNIYVRFAVKNARAWLPTGRFAKDYLVHYGADPKQCFFFPNTPDITDFFSSSQKLGAEKATLKKKWSIHEDFVILFTGRLVRVKGVDLLINAFAQLKEKNIALVIAGSGDEEASLKELAQKLETKGIYFLGFIQPKPLLELYAIADLFVLPSRLEPWAVVVNEAAAFGLPMVLSDSVGAAGDLLREDINGYLFPSQDQDALIQVLEKALQNREKLPQMGKASQEIVFQWDDRMAVENFLQAVKSIYYDKNRN